MIKNSCQFWYRCGRLSLRYIWAVITARYDTSTPAFPPVKWRCYKFGLHRGSDCYGRNPFIMFPSGMRPGLLSDGSLIYCKRHRMIKRQSTERRSFSTKIRLVLCTMMMGFTITNNQSTRSRNYQYSLAISLFMNTMKREGPKSLANDFQTAPISPMLIWTPTTPFFFLSRSLWYKMDLLRGHYRRFPKTFQSYWEKPQQRGMKRAQ